MYMIQMNTKSKLKENGANKGKRFVWYKSRDFWKTAALVASIVGSLLAKQAHQSHSRKSPSAAPQEERQKTGI